MAYKRAIKEQAKQLYVIEGKKIDVIANILSVPSQTLYNWKTKYEWDRAIKTAGNIGLSIELVKGLQDEISKAIAQGKLSDPKTADALCKLVGIVEKVTPGKVMLSNIFNMLEDITHCIQRKLGDDVFLNLWGKYLPEIAEELRSKYSPDNTLSRMNND